MALRRFNANKRPRGMLKQHGANPPYYSLTRRIQQKLQTYENVVHYDSTVSSTLDLLTESLVSSLAPIEHPDEEIQEFLRNNNQQIINSVQADPYEDLKQIIKNTLWAGFSVTEALYEKDPKDGAMKLSGFVPCHPSTITIRTNYKGQLTEGEPSPDHTHTSGIWQRVMYPQSGQTNTTEKRLPLAKTVLLTHNKEFNNYYGRSVIESLYRWHVLKESLLDMFMVAQDQHGNPLTVMMLPNSSSGEVEVDPQTGEERNLTVMQTMERQLSSTSSQEGNTLMIPFNQQSDKPEVKVLSSSSDVAQGYLDAVKFCDQQIIKSLMVPYTLVESQEVGNSQSAERDMEMFNRTIRGLYNRFVVPFVNKVYGNLVWHNFGSEEMPEMPLRNIMRPEDRVSMMQFIRGLTELTYLNPSDEIDREMVRSWVGAIHREWSEEDAEFFQRFLLDPKDDDKVQGASPSPNATPQNKESRSNTRDRSGEGKKKGSGKKGRPTGKATPNVRDKNKNSST